MQSKQRGELSQRTLKENPLSLKIKIKMKKLRYEEQRHNEDNGLTLAVAQLYDFNI